MNALIMSLVMARSLLLEILMRVKVTSRIMYEFVHLYYLRSGTFAKKLRSTYTNKRKNEERTANCSVVSGKGKEAKRKKTGTDLKIHYINIMILSLLR